MNLALDPWTMGPESRGPLSRIAMLLAFALLAPAVCAHAEPPRTITILTVVSTDGAVIIEFGGVSEQECESLATAVQVMGRGEPIEVGVETFGTCRHRIAPQTALPPAQYCIDLPDAQLQLEGPPCFEVTGVTAETMAARIAVDPGTGVGKVGLDDRSCTPCDGAQDDRACTRERRAWLTRAAIEGVEGELASTHVFLIQTSIGPAPVDLPVPGPSDAWTALPTELVYPLAVPIPDSNEEVCVGIYARAAGGGPALLLGRVCLEGSDEAATLPALHVDVPDACAGAYDKRWCDDNREDCGSEVAPALLACDDYPLLCSDASSSTPLATDACDVSSERDAGSAPPLPPDETHAVPGGAGCACRTMGRGRTAHGGSIVFIGVVLALGLVRSRRSDRRCH